MFGAIISFFRVIKNFALNHKKITVALAIVLIGAAFFGYKTLGSTKSETKYVLSAAEKGMIATTVSGTGQVSSSNQITIKTKASGQIVYLNAKSGQQVKAGTLLAQIDTTDAQKSIRDAQESLESAQIALQKVKGADGLSVPRNKQEAQDSLDKSYEDGFNTVSSVFLDLPTIISGLHDILYGYNMAQTQQNINYYTSNADSNGTESSLAYQESAANSYNKARAAYDKNFGNYKASSRFSDQKTIDSLISETYDTTKNIAQAIKDANNLIQYYEDSLAQRNLRPVSTADSHLSSLSGYLTKVNSALSSLYNARTTIKNNQQTLDDADLDLRSQELSVTQRERALQDAKDNLADYYVYAPFDGVVAEVNIKKWDDVSSGTSAITFIAQKKIAELTLSEVDVAKVKTGNKATLTFDAVEDLSISGEVSEVDTLGSSSQGVVSYGVQIAFDTQDDRIKSGMSASVNIITNTKADALIVPSTAVKSQNGSYYVLMLAEKYDLTDKTLSVKGVTSATEPTRKTVETGLSDDTNTEITSGLSEGDQVVVRISTSTSSSSITSSKTSSTRQTQNLFMSGGGAPR